jgi:hypothetical protein
MSENTQLSFDIRVGGNQDQALGSLKAQLREATAEVTKLSEQFGASSKEAVTAAKRAAELKDQIGDAKSLIDAFNPDAKFKALTASLSGVAGGFSALQGAVGLFGKENEDLQKTLVKVQSAMALSQGLQAVGESIDSFKQLGTVIKTQVVSAFSTLRGALIATGIGALAIGIGLVAANFDKVKKAVLSLVPGLAQLGNFFGGIIDKVTDFVGVTSQAERALASLEKTTKRGNEGIEARIKVLTAQGGKEKEIYALSKQQGENELNFLRSKLKTKEGLNEEELKKFRDLKTNQAVLDAEEQKRQQDALKDSAKAGADASKQAAEKRKKDNEDKIAAEKEAQQKLADLRNQLFLSTFKDENEKKKAELNLAFIKEKDEILANTKINEATRNELILASRLKLNADLDALASAEKEKQATADAKMLEETAAKVQKENDDEFAAVQKRIAENKALNDKLKADNDAAREAELQAKFAFASAVAQGIGELTGLFEQGTAASKVAGLAQIAISTGVGFAQGLDIAQKSAKAAGPGAAFAFPIFYATQVAAVLAAASKAKSILAQVKGGGAAAGGVTAPSIQQQAPIAPAQPQAATTNLSTQTINAIGNQAIRSYVVESDVTSNQQRIAAIQQRARFG